MIIRWVVALYFAIVGAWEGAKAGWTTSRAISSNQDASNLPVIESRNVLLRREAWFKWFRRWNACQTWLGILVAGGSAAVASKALDIPLGSGSANVSTYVALVIAILAALQTVLRPESRARSYREAWVILDLAVKEKEGVDTKLVDAVRRGEERIGQRPVDPQKT
jgi:hypothetical protein